MNDSSQHVPAGQLGYKVSHATLVMTTATVLTSAVTAQPESVYQIWRRALKTDDDAVVTDSVFMFRGQLRRLRVEVEQIPFFGPDSKAFALETVNGMESSTVLTSLMNSWSNVADYFQGEKISRLTMIRDVLTQSSPVGMPTEKGLDALRSKLAEMSSLLEAVELPPAIRELLRARLDAVQSALERAAIFGGEVVVAAAGRLAGEVAVVLKAHERAPLSPSGSPLGAFARATIEFLDVAGRVSLVWDAGQFVLEHADKAPNLFRLLG